MLTRAIQFAFPEAHLAKFHIYAPVALNIRSHEGEAARILCGQLRPSSCLARCGDAPNGAARERKAGGSTSGLRPCLMPQSWLPRLFFGATQWNPFHMALFSG